MSYRDWLTQYSTLTSLTGRPFSIRGREKGWLMTISIRRADPKDADVLTSIALAAKRHWGYPEDMMSLWTADLTITAEFIRDNAVYCALCDDAMVGFYAIIEERIGWGLDHMWVLPEFMGLGLGRRLLEHARIHAQELGTATLRIVADPHAEAFYARFGARTTGTIPSLPAGRVLPVMELTVA